MTLVAPLNLMVTLFSRLEFEIPISCSLWHFVRDGMMGKEKKI